MCSTFVQVNAIAKTILHSTNTKTYLDASLDVEVVDCSFDNQVPWMRSSYSVAAASAWDVEHLDNVVVAYIDWDHFALHDVDAVEHGSSFRFDTLNEMGMCDTVSI